MQPRTIVSILLILAVLPNMFPIESIAGQVYTTTTTAQIYNDTFTVSATTQETCYYRALNLGPDYAGDQLIGTVQSTAYMNFAIMSLADYDTFKRNVGKSCGGLMHPSQFSKAGTTIEITWNIPAGTFYLIFLNPTHTAATVSVELWVVEVTQQTYTPYTYSQYSYTPYSYTTSSQTSYTNPTPLTALQVDPVYLVTALAAVVLIAIILLSASGKLKASDKARQRRKKQQPVPPLRTEKGLGKQFCLNCGVELPLGSKFCNKCGTKQP